jgi:hypothetical protein
LPFSPHKPFEQEGQEVGEGIELAVLHNTLSQNSKGKRLENHKIPDSFVSVITKFRNIGQKKSDSLHRRPLQIFNRY